MRASLAAIVVAIFIGFFAFTTPARAADDGIDSTSTTTYQAVPAKGFVRVSVTQKITNRIMPTFSSYPCIQYFYDPYWGYTPYPSTCQRTTRTYVDSAYLWVDRTAKQLHVTANGQAVRLTKSRTWTSIREYKVTFPRIFNGQTRTINATFVVPGGKPRSKDDVRVNSAYLNFWALPQPTDRSTVRVEVPKAFKATTWGGDASETTSGQTRVFSSGDVDPETYYLGVTGTNETGFATQKLTTIDGRSVSLQGWPGDSAWMSAVQKEAAASVSRIQAIIGQPLPGTGPVVIREIASSDLGDAYIGEFNRVDQTALISEDFTQAGTVTHELSHAWFNDALFKSTWMSEGYAQWMERAAGAVGSPCPEPSLPVGAHPDLGSWQFAGPKATGAEVAMVGYQYDAACAIVSDVAARIGTNRMRDVIGVLATTDGAYPGVPDVAAAGPVDWKAWLDAVDERGMGPAALDDTHAAADLLVKYGIATPADLSGRAGARTALDQLRSDDLGWAVPLAVTRPMAAWRFPAALTAVSDAESTLASVAQVEAALPSVTASANPIRDSFENAGDITSLEAAQKQAAAQLEVAQELAAVVASESEVRNPLEDLGLVGTNLTAQSDEAVSAVASMHLDKAHNDAVGLKAALAGAATSGVIRVGLGLLAVFAVALGFALIRRRRRSPSAPVANESTREGFDDPASDPGVAA